MADPLHLLDAAHVRGLLQRLRLTRLLGRFHERLVWAAFMFVNGFVTIALLAVNGGLLAYGVSFDRRIRRVRRG